MKRNIFDKRKRLLDLFDTFFSIIMIIMGIAFIIIGLSGDSRVDLVPTLVIGVGLIFLGIISIIIGYQDKKDMKTLKV